MQHILACIDASAYANSVCDLAAWASRRLQLPVELLHVVQRRDAVAARHDLSGAIGLGVKTNLMEELVQLEESDARLQVERGRVLLAAAKQRLQEGGVDQVRSLHRHGGIVETILEREADARVVVIGKRGAGHEFASDHIGSKIERVVRASDRPILIASRAVSEPGAIVFAFDASKSANRALERLVNSPLFTGLPVHIVMADSENAVHRQALDDAAGQLRDSHEVRTTLRQGKPETVIADIVDQTPGAMLMMGAYGHSPLRTLIVGSTTTAMIRTVHVPVLLVR
ncbi:universal stress protein [Sphingobium scionense]|jgi:nucleotide-binding universal stress UspA family protein|uniref:Nucleotide-binding universal stress UspA family protein n=1 Tax=Sphingobium scionense TaxID=1404341 RepID=A0A7W6LX61_9SPHN|nr:universal stress protein [Sphingobium scionense]MBB4152041.1 nucleotide-binding universal stress UspA family protein [Sphingobium scionense]MDE0945365.1 universal stress protein [Sphingobium sp.]|tara:strand:+ start:1650 stop:2501 length:852 start_codon:yes stop_codon:yes gene_type:complete